MCEMQRHVRGVAEESEAQVNRLLGRRRPQSRRGQFCRLSLARQNADERVCCASYFFGSREELQPN